MIEMKWLKTINNSWINTVNIIELFKIGDKYYARTIPGDKYQISMEDYMMLTGGAS